jgi:hypothetical protein
MSECLKCKKEYIPKRQGGKFCSTNCRVAYNQKVKRGYAIPNPPASDEAYLSEKLALVGRLATPLADAIGLSIEARPNDFQQQVNDLIRYCATFSDNSVIDGVQRRQKLRLAAENREQSDKTIGK